MATSRRTGNYSTSAKAVVRASDQIFDAAMSGKPDFTKISKEAIKGRSLERRAVTKAEGEVASAGLDAFTKAKYAKLRADTAKEVESIKRPARRMAGVVGALGTLSGAYILNQTNKKDKAAHDEWMKKFDERTKAMDARLSIPNPEPELIPDPPTFQRPTLSTDQPSNTGSNSQPTSSSSQQLTSSDGWKKWSKVIRYAEGTLGDKGYNTQFTGTTFDDMSRHPRQIRSSNGLSSDAAGAYQFLSTTWDGARKALNLPDFSPSSQEAAGRYLTQGRGVNPDSVVTDFDSFRRNIDKLAKEWAGLPYSGKGVNGGGYGSSYYGQGGKSIEELWKIYSSN